MICRNEVENRLGSLGKHKQEWNLMAVMIRWDWLKRGFEKTKELVWV